MENLSMSNLNTLLGTLSEKKGRRVRGLKLLYKFDPLSIENFHHYVDKK